MSDEMFTPEPAGTGSTRRVCRNCNEDKPVVPGAWAFKPGGEPLQICLVCQTLRKEEAKKPRKTDGPKTPAAIRGDAKVDIAKSLRSGAAIANEYADVVLARILGYATDPTHKLHAWALDFLGSRIMPRKMYDDLGEQAAGLGTGDKRPQFVIQVLPAQPQEPTGRVINATPIPPVLPAPQKGSDDAK
jgi:hypothetical protein